MGKFLKECYLQKTNQFDALRLKKFCPAAIEIGAELKLEYEKENPSSKDKVVVKTLGEKGSVVGVLSDEDTKDIKPYLEMEWNDVFLCRVSKHDFSMDENKRLSIAISVRKKGEEDG